MDLYEYQAKELFAAHGVPAPAGRVARSVDEAVRTGRGHEAQEVLDRAILRQPRGSKLRGELYRRLLALRKAHPALRNGAAGGRMVRVPNTTEAAVLSFVRAVEGDRVFAAFNFSAQEQTVTLGDGPQAGTWTDPWSGETVELTQGQSYTLPAWGHQVLVGS